MLSHHTNTLTHQHTLRVCWCARCRCGVPTLVLPEAACRGPAGRLAPFRPAAPCGRNPSTNPHRFTLDRLTLDRMTTLTADSLEAEDLTAWCTFRLAVAELAELKDHAHVARISTSELVRRRVLGLPPPKAAVPSINSQIYAELGRIGVNLNQLTRIAHETGPQMQLLGRVLAELKGQLDRVRMEVIGADQVSEEDQE